MTFLGVVRRPSFEAGVVRRPSFEAGVVRRSSFERADVSALSAGRVQVATRAGGQIPTSAGAARLAAPSTTLTTPPRTTGYPRYATPLTARPAASATPCRPAANNAPLVQRQHSSPYGPAAPYSPEPSSPRTFSPRKFSPPRRRAEVPASAD